MNDGSVKTVEIIGVRFKSAGKIYYFDPDGKLLNAGDNVIVETSRGIELGNVVVPNKKIPETEIVSPLKKLLRIADENDMKKHAECREVENKARSIWAQKVRDHGLDMALSDVEYTFDNSKLIFYFTADGRVDFREFVKDLANVFKTRIELRQIGVRDEAKQLGGLGICGRPFCCKTFLEDFQQVSIKMAKVQGLSLNSAKISGTCGRLMCCLRYENDTYEKESKNIPKVDSVVMSPDGQGVVVETNILCGKVKVRLDSDASVVCYDAPQLKVLSSPKRDEKKEEEEIPEDLL